MGLCVLLAAGPGRSQPVSSDRPEGKKPSVYRVASSLVLVDTLVTDKHNRPVLNLSPQDFTVLEDEVPQVVDSLRLVGPHASVPAPGRPQNEAAVAAEFQRHSPAGSLTEEKQYMVLLLDDATTELEDQAFVRPAAQRYFREQMRPNLQVAVVRVGLSARLLQDFTNQPGKIVRALEQQDATANGYSGERQSLQRSIDGARTTQTSLQQDLNSLATGANSADSRAGNRASEITALLSSAVREEKRAFATQSFANQQQSRPVLEAIRAIAHSVEALPGRKSLVLISRGFSIPEPLEGLLYRTTHAANRARVAIYSLDSGGLRNRPASFEGELHRDIGALQVGSRAGNEFGETEFDRARQVGSDQQDSTLRYLSSATGGLLIRHTNDFAGAFGRIEQDSHSYYLLTYRPKNQFYDGQFRKIRVAVNRPDLEVRARAGYFALPPGAAALSPSEFQQLLAVANGLNIQDFPLYIEPANFLEIDGTYNVELPVEIPQSEIAGDGKVEVFGLVRSTNGETITSFHSPAQRRSSLAAGQATSDGWVLFANNLRLGPGTYAIELGAVNGLAGRRSYRHASLSLASAENSLAVSSLTLSHRVESAPEGEVGPWKVGKVRILPSSDRHFRNQQNLIFYFDVYYPKLSPATGRPDLNVTFSLECDGRSLNVDVPAFHASDVQPLALPTIQIARYLALAGLSPGSYLLRARVQDLVGGRSVSTQASFELIP